MMGPANGPQFGEQPPDDLDPLESGGASTGITDVDTLRVARDALKRAAEVLGETVSGWSDRDGAAPPDRSEAGRALQRAWDATSAQARELAAARDERLVALVDLMSVLRSASEAVGAGVSSGASPVRRVRERLAALSSLSSLDEIVDHVPAAAAALGFDRVLLSRVEESVWVPSRLYFKGDAKWADEILDAMQKQPLPLDSSLLETQMVRRAVPLRVLNPAKRPLMNRLMITLSHTPGYVAAPIVDADVVVGFLHADCYYEGRVPSQGDLDALWLFSQALGPMLGRRALAERLTALRDEATLPLAVLGGVGPSAARTIPPRGSPAGHPQGSEDEPDRQHALRAIVTSREADVLTLLTQGASNEQIARSLGISLGTVKSHVKRILRRLDVTNRAEAASLWLRSEYGEPERRGR